MNVQVLTFARDEQETVLLFDYDKSQWLFETTVQKHITLAKKRFGDTIIVTATDENGRPTRIRCWIPEEAITLRSLDSIGTGNRGQNLKKTE